MKKVLYGAVALGLLFTPTLAHAAKGTVCFARGLTGEVLQPLTNIGEICARRGYAVKYTSFSGTAACNGSTAAFGQSAATGILQVRAKRIVTVDVVGGGTCPRGSVCVNYIPRTSSWTVSGARNLRVDSDHVNTPTAMKNQIAAFLCP